MNGSEVAILFIVAAAIGGAVGAKTAKAAPWKGAVSTIAGGIAFFLVAGITHSTSILVPAIVGLLATGVCGGALKLSGQQLTQVGLGGILFSVVAGIFIAK